MKHYITQSQATQYARLENLAREIDQKIQEMTVAIVQAGIPDEDKIGALNYLSRADGLADMSYALHVQSEWQGGEAWKLVRPDLTNIAR
jgi:hypothetical protein